MSWTQSGATVGRRRFLQATAAVAAGTALLGFQGRVGAQAGVDLSEWFADVSNYEGVIDRRGERAVTVTVGARGNGGGFAFGPAAVRVDPGTTVTWEWTGAGGVHNVAAEDGAYESPLLGDAGATFEHVFGEAGVSTYACTPHKAMGMKGAIVVGDVAVTTPTPAYEYVDREPDYGDWFDGVDAFTGTVDLRGQREVRVRVGATDDGALAFTPPAIHVDPGTNVIWEFGSGDSHQLRAADGSYESPRTDGGEWGLRFDGVGVSKYACATHGDAGLRGAVVVGDVFANVYDVSVNGLTLAGSVGAAFLSPLAFGAFLWYRGRRGGGRRN